MANFTETVTITLERYEAFRNLETDITVLPEAVKREVTAEYQEEIDQLRAKVAELEENMTNAYKFHHYDWESHISVYVSIPEDALRKYLSNKGIAAEHIDYKIDDSDNTVEFNQMFDIIKPEEEEINE